MSGRGIKPTRGGSIRSLTGSQQKSLLVQGKTLALIIRTNTGSSLSSRVANDQASDKRSTRSTRSTGTDELAGSGRPVRRARLPDSDDEEAEDIHSPAGIRARRYARCALLIMLILLSRLVRVTTVQRPRNKAAREHRIQPVDKPLRQLITLQMTHTSSNQCSLFPSFLRHNRLPRSQRRYVSRTSLLRRATESEHGSTG
jgi:hypothetical protein